MTLKQQLTDDMKTAMRGGDKHRLGVIRLMLAAIKQREVDDRVEQTDALVLATLEKMLKQRRDSISQYDAAGRDDLATIERAEMAVIETYLPAKLSEAEIDTLIDAAIAETGASSPRDMGKVVAAVKDKAAGRADMAVVSGKIKARLAP
ncbi:GatB/YqeY domain-containing protein [Rhodanobacter caeni]|uniref:GatB/YqeY domain-containing protein n=1 Tax=Rhodanobacter caeni TaxID=657654 RepID=A0ABP3E9F2_9GAMM